MCVIGYMLKTMLKAIDLIFHEGKSGETYNIGGNHETNIDIVLLLKFIRINR